MDSIREKFPFCFHSVATNCLLFLVLISFVYQKVEGVPCEEYSNESLSVIDVYVSPKLQLGAMVTKLSLFGKTPLLTPLASPSDRQTNHDNSVFESFQIDFQGYLVVAADLSSHSNEVLLYHVTYPEKKLQFTLQIHITEMLPSSSPVFSFQQIVYHGSIKENMPPFTKANTIGLLCVHCGAHFHSGQQSQQHLQYTIKTLPDIEKKCPNNLNLEPVSFHLQEYQYSPYSQLQLFSRDELDREKQDQYLLLIEAENSEKQKASAIVHLFVENENDNVPIFEKQNYWENFWASLPGGSKILQVKAKDLDGDDISYSLVPKQTLFSVNPKLGSIFVKRGEYVPPGNYHFQVVATDKSGNSSQPANVFVGVQFASDMLKFVPRIRKHHSISKRAATMTRIELTNTVSEAVTSNEILFSVASNPPPPVGVESYQIVDSLLPGMFQVNTLGSVFLMAGRKLDYETPSHRLITARVEVTKISTGEVISELILTLHVTDVNDERPVFINKPRPFLATVSSNPQVGELVYELMAEDPDTNSDIKYILESAGEGKFAIEHVQANGFNVGRIVTTVSGQGQFRPNMTFELVVSARDMSALDSVQKSDFEIVKVFVGYRPPQFFEDPYIGYVTENNQAGYKLETEDGALLKIVAKPFQSSSLGASKGYEGLVKYVLKDSKGQASSYFFINEKGEIETLQSLDFEAAPAKQFSWTIVATEERTGLVSQAKLLVNLIDYNDNSPVFDLSTYTYSTSEGQPVNSILFSVTATDADYGINANLTYAVSDDHFYVTTRFNENSGHYIGDLRVKKSLDYDYRPERLYKFNITATDQGSPPKQGWASVMIYVTNINDEKPQFSTGSDDLRASVREDLEANGFVTMIQASDPDGDNVEYYFSEKLTQAPNGPFKIDPKSGIVQLTRTIPPGVSSYSLNITAYDDGSCCGELTIQHQETILVVEVKDINNNNPTFPDCNYQPSILENQPLGTHVVNVHAVDNDRGQNGQITYSIVTPAYQEQKFGVDPDNGTVFTRVMFDRESEYGSRGYPVTVKAEDKGESQPLNSLCTFWVKIEDINDNSPVFDSPIYRQIITRTHAVDSRVTGVLATDKDSGLNAEIEYVLSGNPGGYFKIDSEMGDINLAKSLTELPYSVNQTMITVTARDKGSPSLNSSVDVILQLRKSEGAIPTWDGDYDGTVYGVNETVPIGYVIATFSAKSNQNDSAYQGLTFALIKSDGSQAQYDDTFMTRMPTSNSVRLVLRTQLNYKIQNRYMLRLRVSNQGVNSGSNEIRITIKVRDMNNEIPRFEGLDPSLSNTYVGSVPENEPFGQTVITVKAVDDDADPPNNVIKYSIVKDTHKAHEKFIINPETGLITTNYTFDREAQSLYYLVIKAEDGKASDNYQHLPENTPNSATALVQIEIGDKNDNFPQFQKPLYRKSVQEQPPDSSKTVLKVTADDVDVADILTYTISSGNVGNVFGIKQKTGEIYVAKDLDYELPIKLYNLTVTVNDGYHTNTTRVELTVTDINDNQPEFTQKEYVIYDVVEEVEPKPGEKRFLIQVSATDKDVDRPHNFRYTLNYDDVNTFSIGHEDGRIYLHKPLDRDFPNGRAEYQFNIMVEDEPGNAQSLLGYAYVKIKPKDINDNPPVFVGNLTGQIAENSAKGKNIMTVRAEDYDMGLNGSVYYQIDGRGNIPIDPTNREYLFMIKEKTGLIYSNTDTLDREVLDRYSLQIIAYDNGVPQLSSTAIITIQVTDENDEAPVFLQKIYKATLSESQLSGPVITVSATDDDINEYAKLTYSLENGLSFFSIKSLPSNAGVITVFNPVDYETASQRFFNLTVRATDTNPDHEDHAFVEITVTDANDITPKFTETVKIIEKEENIPVDSLLGTFEAFDGDNPPNNEFTFSIQDYSDRFYVEQEGNLAHVRIQRGLDGQTLDREDKSKYTVEILAIDKGIPARTGIATLIINVLDINDRAPTFAKDYRPIVMEDEPFPKDILTFKAIDLDTRMYGPPFIFSLPPCELNPVCEKSTGKLNFTLKFIPSGDGGNGTGIVTAQNRFFREQQKFYTLPIIMRDMGGSNPLSQTGTSTLTIEIGDKNNNQHEDGTKHIFVYNYKGLFGDVNIGRANAKDLDDWDFVDKNYYLIGPSEMRKFFSVAEINGTITMKKGVPGGRYQFKVNVYDRVVFRSRNATATIIVTVKEIGDDAIYSSGSVRLTGITAEEFVEDRPGDSYYNRFKSLLARKLDVSLSNVAIFSVINNGQFLDVRYAAHGSPYYPPSKLDGIVLTFKQEFALASGGTIAVINIDECIKEVCESGGCSNKLVIDSKKPNLVNTKGHTFVGVATHVVGECTCKARDFSKPLECTPDYCYNGGTCVMNLWKEINCTCLPGFDGSRCQKTRHSFNGGYALFPPLAQCEESSTSIEFITTVENGLIFYNGPVENTSLSVPSDFIALELIAGYPRLQIDHGTGKVILVLDGKDKKGITRLHKLNDGTWHHIDILRKGREVTMIVDYCKSSTFESVSETREDRNPCQISATTRGRNKYLNVNSMLQMGGRYITPPYPTGITKDRFKGCIRNLYHNGEVYDLFTGKNHPGINHDNDCPQEDNVCHSNGAESVCGPHGKCQIAHWESNQAECKCDPGFRLGASGKCDTNTTIRDLKDEGFMTWELKNDMYNILNRRILEVKVSFRTRDPDGGVLLHLPSNSHEYITLEIVNKHLQVTYNLKDYNAPLQPNVLALSSVEASNGHWHHVTLKRIGKWFQLKMDSGEGRYLAETWGAMGESQEFNLRKDQIVAGARVMFLEKPKFDGRNLMDTCITDIRIDDKWFPMQEAENILSPAANLVLYPSVLMGCHRDDCKNIVCPHGEPIQKVCVGLWDDFECRCPPGSHPGQNDHCEPILYCHSNPCYSGGTCIELDFPLSFMCNCPPDWGGKLCNQMRQSTVVPGGVTTEALVIIIVSIFSVLLIALLVFLLVKNLRFGKKEKSILYGEDYDDVRENVMDHDEEGAGEEDQDGYDINRLRKPDMCRPDMPLFRGRYLGKAPPGEPPEVGQFIKERLQDADDDPGAPPHDNVMEFAYEGGDSIAGSLSSLQTSSSDDEQEYDYLNDWGPKFKKLKDLYGPDHPLGAAM